MYGSLGARRQIRFRLNTSGGRGRLEAPCGEAVPAVPHGDTVADYLVTVDPTAVQRVAPAMVRCEYAWVNNIPYGPRRH